MIISIIVAVADNWVIGKKNALPWYLPADLKHFKEITMGHHIIMGQKTHESISRALPGRTNIVLSFDKDFKSDGCVVTHSMEEALRIAEKAAETEVFIIGGASVYKQAINLADKIYMTRIHNKVDGDVFFPEIDEKKWKEISREEHVPDDKNPFKYEFLVLEKNN